MGIFRSKNKDKQRNVNLTYIDGLKDIKERDSVNVLLNNSTGNLEITTRFYESAPHILSISKITDIQIVSEKDIIEKQKSVCGRAVAGTLILGPLGAIVGGMSGIGRKSKTSVTYFIVINYLSNNTENALSFEIVPASYGAFKLLDEIKALIPPLTPSMDEIEL